jgi:hypothetical protein
MNTLAQKQTKGTKAFSLCVSFVALCRNPHASLVSEESRHLELEFAALCGGAATPYQVDNPCFPSFKS